MSSNELIIKEAISAKDYANVIALHKTIWGIDDLRVIPEHILIAVQKSNGLVLLAFDKDKPVGFSFGFCGLTKDYKPFFYSHNLGVLEAYRNKGVGWLLKVKQREIIMERSLSLITWTFDPLESRNAYFNLKLGCVIRQYIRDYYGDMPDQLNAKVPSDRFITEWWIKSNRVEKHLTMEYPRYYSISEEFCINRSTYSAPNIITPVDGVYNFELLDKPNAKNVFIEVPSNYQELRQIDMRIILSWRLNLRCCIEKAFEKRYVITGFSRQSNRSYYVLEKDSSSMLL